MKLYIDKFENENSGQVIFAVSDIGLRFISFGRYRGLADILEHACKYGFTTEENLEKTAGIKKQLLEYLKGFRDQFETHLDIDYLSPFKRKVLKAAIKVPFGKMISYGELARKAGSPKAARAVGQTMASNPIPIVIPCHRVVGSTGHLTGYSGGDGIEQKKLLLKLEGITIKGIKVSLN